MEIVKAIPADLPRLEALYADARAYMRARGNAGQWTGGYPDSARILRDISDGNCYICQENGELYGAFCYFFGDDPTYEKIDGSWLSDGPYGVIHRIAVRVHRKGVASACFRFGLERAGNLRIDTHADNIPMQRALEKNGFARCGVICLENGDPRIAFQRDDRPR